MSPNAIKVLRERLSLTQTELALVCGLASKQVVSNLETGFRNPSGPVLRILQVLESLPKKEAVALVAKMKREGERRTHADR